MKRAGRHDGAGTMKQNSQHEGEEITVNGIRYALWKEDAGAAQAQVTGCEDLEGAAVILEEVKGHSVRSLAPYAFSAKRIGSLTLPKTIEKAGKYVFYRCFDLKRLCFSDAFTDIGAGAFTGCRLEELEIDHYQGEQSCLKFIADEIRYALRVTLRYHRPDGQTETARVVFPEHYEEAVENTPARIVETHYHGAGGYYRQSFYNKELNYPEYDSLFPLALAQEEEEILADIASYRLRFPYRLERKAEEQYLEYLAGHMAQAGKQNVLREDMDMLRFFGEKRLWDRESFAQAVETASGEKKPEILAYLMDQKRRLFPGRKKTFDL